MTAIETSATADPPCPYCGERQRYADAIPSKPMVSARYVDRVVRGRIVYKRDTYYNTHCRACEQRIVWSMRLGNGSLEQIATGRATFSWSKPS